MALCTSADVNALLSALLGDPNFSIDDTLLANSISIAQETLQSRCSRPLTPTRIKLPVDGNGKTRYVMPYFPILGIHSVDIYYNYPLSLTRSAKESDFIINRDIGTIAFPPYAYTMSLAPYAFNFWKSSMNVQLDYVVGWTRNTYGETLTTADHLTYTFSNPTVVKQTIGTVPTQLVAPTYGPVISIDGVPQTNTVYTLNNAVNTGIWEIQSDNLIYTLNQANTGGYASITFPTSQVGHVITADYAYAYTPANLKDACMKLAAITILNATALAPYSSVTTGGMTSVQVNGYRTQANDRGQFGPQIATFETEIEATVQHYKSPVLPRMATFMDNNGSLRY